MKLKCGISGSHDNGYTGNLAAAQTTGHIQKLVILRTYSQMAREFHSLQLPSFEIPGLFLSNKISHMFGGATPARQYSPLPAAPTQLDDQSRYSPPAQSKPPSSPKKQHSKFNRSSSDVASDRKSNKKREYITRKESTKYKLRITGHPAPCNFKYLGNGCTNTVSMQLYHQCSCAHLA